MKSAVMPENEERRLEDLKSYAVLDTPPEKQFDDLTELAASILDTPIALVSLIDEERQWFKSHHGLAATETPREIAFCAHAILQNEVFHIRDSREDERFFDNPLVTDPKVVFYAGAPLISPEGNKLGTLCVIDHKPRDFSDENKRQLEIIASQVMSQMQLRKHVIQQSRGISELALLAEEVSHKNQELARINKDLNNFTAAASHDLRSPLVGIDQLASWIAEDLQQDQLKDIPENLSLIKQRVNRLNILLNDLLEYARVGQDQTEIEKIDAKALVEDIFVLTVRKDFELDIKTELPFFETHKVPFERVFHNLISNAIKHHDKGQGRISITCEDHPDYYLFGVEDDGPGIEPQYHEHIFDMFKTLKSRDQVEGSGMGLSMIRKIVENYGGKVSLESKPGDGATFYFSWPKKL